VKKIETLDLLLLLLIKLLLLQLRKKMGGRGRDYFFQLSIRLSFSGQE